MLVNLTSLLRCPLQVPPARHRRRAEKRWSYIYPSFCLHQNSAWGKEQRWDHGERRAANRLDLSQRSHSRGADLRISSPNMPNWQRRVSDGHQRSSLVQEEDAVLLLKDLQMGTSVCFLNWWHHAKTHICAPNRGNIRGVSEGWCQGCADGTNLRVYLFHK